MQSFEISKFKGVNKIVEASKLEPGETQQLYGALINNGSIQSMPMPSYETKDVSFPVPHIELDQTGFTIGSWNPGAAASSTTVSGAIQHRIAFHVNYSLGVDIPVTVMLLLKGTYATATSNIYMSIYTETGAQPTTDITAKRLQSFTLRTSDPNRVWRGFTATASQATGGVCWFVFDIVIADASSHTLYGHPSQSTLTKYQSGGAWTDWGVAWPGKDKPQFMVIDSQQTTNARDVHQMTTVKTPFRPWQGSVTVGSFGFSTATPLTYFGGAALCVLEVPEATSDYKRTIILAYDPSGGGTCISTLAATGFPQANIVTSINLIRVGNVIAATAPGVEFCFPLTLLDWPAAGFDVDYSATSFQNYIALCGGGTDGTTSITPPNKKPCYIDLTAAGLPIHSGYAGISVRGYGAAGTPDEPMYVMDFGNHLIYFRNADYPFRMWYGIAGQIDSFNADENLSQAEPILSVEKYGNEFLVFFASEIKKYSGVPRYAVLSRVKDTGVLNSRFVKPANNGVFILSTDGFWFFNGVFNQVLDKPSILQNNKQRYLCQASDYTIHQPRLIHFPNIHSVGLVFQRYSTNPYNHTAIWLYDYWTGDWNRYYMITSGSYGGTFQMSAIPYETTWIYDGSYKGLMLESDSKFSPFIVETGWIDVDSRMDKKRFLHFTMEATNPAASQIISVTIDYDNGVSYTFDSVDLRVTDGGVYTKIEKMVPATASRFKILVSCNTTGTPAPTNEQVKIHKFNMFYEPGKQK